MEGCAVSIVYRKVTSQQYKITPGYQRRTVSFRGKQTESPLHLENPEPELPSG